MELSLHRKDQVKVSARILSGLVKSLKMTLLCSVLIHLSGCQLLKSKKPSILVIMVEGLGFEAISCHRAEEENDDGFSTFCREGIHFNHAYTPSPLSQPGIASLLTAQYPHSHGVVDNGQSYLRNSVETIAERALEKKYNTAFFSGGAPIWSRSGFGQGFEYFDDTYQFGLNNLYQPVSENFSVLLNWLDQQSEKFPYFVMSYVPDLQFSQFPTRNDLGEIRESTYEGQLRELDESLGTLIKGLKERNRWDSTHVFLLGLNGWSGLRRPNELRPTNLYSEVVHVSLFIKPARKKRDGPYNWKVDKNVSLVDVGATLHHIVTGESISHRDHIWPVISLEPLLNNAEADWDEHRPLLISSDWTAWHSLGPPRKSVRAGYSFFLFDQPVKVYNTLVDRMEAAPMLEGEDLLQSYKEQIGKFASLADVTLWESPGVQVVRRYEIAREMFIEPEVSSQQQRNLNAYLGTYGWDPAVVGWAARRALSERDWKTLWDLAREYQNPIWQYVAGANLNESVEVVDEGCFGYFRKTRENYQTPSRRECDNPVFVDLLEWVLFNGETGERNRRKEAFLRLWENFDTKRRIAELDWALTQTWGAHSEAALEPHLIELYLHLPENKSYLDEVQRRVLRKY